MADRAVKEQAIGTQAQTPARHAQSQHGGACMHKRPAGSTANSPEGAEGLSADALCQKVADHEP